MNRFVLDAMCSNPVMIGPDRDAKIAANEAREHGVHHVIVTDGAHVIGVVATTELEQAADGASVGSLIGPEPTICVEQQATVAQAESIMNRHDVDCLPVVSWEGLLAGVITRGDVRRIRQENRLAGAKRQCAACGTNQDLVVEPDIVVSFCRDCLSRGHAPSNPEDELYFTLGGGD